MFLLFQFPFGTPAPPCGKSLNHSWLRGGVVRRIRVERVTLQELESPVTLLGLFELE